MSSRAISVVLSSTHILHRMWLSPYGKNFMQTSSWYAMLHVEQYETGPISSPSPQWKHSLLVS
eukprot:scaffold38204_cov66-Cyclotella_meneghiniana.AAC.1